jgi:hypothetical protein
MKELFNFKNYTSILMIHFPLYSGLRLDDQNLLGNFSGFVHRSTDPKGEEELINNALSKICISDYWIRSPKDSRIFVGFN